MQMRDSFERVKTGFGNSDEDFYEINVPGLPDDEDLAIEDGYHSISTNDLQAIFDPVVNRIVGLVQDQVNEVRRKGKSVAVRLRICPAVSYPRGSDAKNIIRQSS